MDQIEKKRPMNILEQVALPEIEMPDGTGHCSFLHPPSVLAAICAAFQATLHAQFLYQIPPKLPGSALFSSPAPAGSGTMCCWGKTYICPGLAFDLL
jgi:hypothetical protein